VAFRHEGAFGGGQPHEADPRRGGDAANVADSTVLPELLHGDETRVWGDQAYRGQRAVIREHAPRARDFTNRRYRHRGVVDEVERAKNGTKSKVRAPAGSRE
jgi:IS5 family transposase